MHICTNCGVSSRHQKVIPDRCVLVCPDCGNEDAFKHLPIFFLLGGGGSGKTSVSFRLTGQSHRFFVFDTDLVGFMSHASNAAKPHFQVWMSRQLARNGVPIVYCGWDSIDDCESAADLKYFSSVHYLVLAPSPKAQEQRLRGRFGTLRDEPHDDDFISMSLQATEILVGQARRRPNATVIDSTNQTVDESVDQVQQIISNGLGDE